MNLAKDHYYDAYCARDSRFDGVFYTGIKSTGVYCRPVCPARTPKRENCTFFPSAAAAEQSSFRPCLRCRPELAPGYAPIDDSSRIASLVASRLQLYAEDENMDLEKIADQFQLSSRQVRRIIKKEFGVPPIQLIQTNRLLLAKQLLTETNLSITQVAFTSGFSSLRRFNDAFVKFYKMPPRKFIKDNVQGNNSAENAIILKLQYRPPYDWENVLKFLQGRSLIGVENIASHSYNRTVEIGEHRGHICVSHNEQNNCLNVRISEALLPVLPSVLERVKQLFDVKANPTVINNHLSGYEELRLSIEMYPGLRLPGAFDPFEMVVRAILGQQVTVKAATTIAGRFVNAFGESLETNEVDLSRLTPKAERVAQSTVDEVASHGIVSKRASAILTVARKMVEGELLIDGSVNPEVIIPQLTQISGIGPWTAHYIAMRALGWPNAFPKEDIVLQKMLGGVSAKQADELSQNWHPWRSYAAMHLWKQSEMAR